MIISDSINVPINKNGLAGTMKKLNEKSRWRGHFTFAVIHTCKYILKSC